MKRKCSLIVVLTLLMCIADLEYALAATGLSKAEESILEELKTEIEIDGNPVKLPVAYLNQVENEFIKNKSDLTEEQAEIINSKIEEALGIVKTLDFKEQENALNYKSVLKLLQLVNEAAAVADYKVTFDIANYSVNITDPEGNIVYVAKNQINQTGSSVASPVMGSSVVIPPVIIISIMAGVMLTCVIVSNHMGKLEKTQERKDFSDEA